MLIVDGIRQFERRDSLMAPKEEIERCSLWLRTKVWPMWPNTALMPRVGLMHIALLAKERAERTRRDWEERVFSVLGDPDRGVFLSSADLEERRAKMTAEELRCHEEISASIERTLGMLTRIRGVKREA